MNYKCKSCGGSAVYSPKHKKMFCPHCEQIDSAIKVGDGSMANCPNCGAELEPGEYDSSSICPYCDNYIIYDERVENDFKPDTIIPFKVDKDEAIEKLHEMFKSRVFAPAAFLDEVRLKGMKGYYVPFFLYDLDTNTSYEGTGTKSRTWRSGNYRYTETSYYRVSRRMKANFDEIPADASLKMPDSTMDLMEPYEYRELSEFDSKYMSGFFGEIYNKPSSFFINRAKDKAAKSAKEMVSNSVFGYESLNPTPMSANVHISEVGTKYALFPVWVYDFEWNSEKYPIYVNGQTGKVVGKTPVSKSKVVTYGIVNGGIFLTVFLTLAKILEVIL